MTHHFRRPTSTAKLLTSLTLLLLLSKPTSTTSFGDLPEPLIDNNFGEESQFQQPSNSFSFNNNNQANEPGGLRLVPFRMESPEKKDPFASHQVPISGILQALLGDNQGDSSPPQIRIGRSFNPFESLMQPRRRFPLFNNMKYNDRVVYPYPEECEKELHGQCLGLVRVCSDDGCTLECEKTGGPPAISTKCKKAHPCAKDMEKLCKVMGDEKRLFKCLVRHKSNVSKACKVNEPCLQDDSKDCNLKGVGRHIFGRAANDDLTKPNGQKSFGEKHEIDACSCKKHFGGFSGCGAHMTHPFCLPCGENCIRNPVCGTGALWCEVQDNDKCLTDKNVKTFEYKLNQIEGNKQYIQKFPKSMLGQKYRTCKSPKHVGLGSWLKDIMEPMATRIEDNVEDLVERQKSRIHNNQTFNDEKLKNKDKTNDQTSAADGAADGAANVLPGLPGLKETPYKQLNVKDLNGGIDGTNADMVEDSILTPDIVSASELMKSKNTKVKKPVVVVDNNNNNNIKNMEQEDPANNNIKDIKATVAVRGEFMKYLWMGIGIAVVATVVISFRKKRTNGRRRRGSSTNERVSMEVGDEFL